MTSEDAQLDRIEAQQIKMNQVVSSLFEAAQQTNERLGQLTQILVHHEEFNERLSAFEQQMMLSRRAIADNAQCFDTLLNESRTDRQRFDALIEEARAAREILSRRLDIQQQHMEAQQQITQAILVQLSITNSRIDRLEAR